VTNRAQSSRRSIAPACAEHPSRPCFFCRASPRGRRAHTLAAMPSLLRSLLPLSLLLLGGGSSGAAAAGCGGPRDCNMAGTCVGGTCACTTGFAGASCDALAMEAYRCADGGLCLANGSATWGGSVVRADDGTFHMYAAMMTDNTTLQSWLTNSVVLHAVAPAGHPEGPYEPADIALAPRSPPHFFDSVMIHNPDAKRTRDGTYVIFYDGSSRPPADAGVGAAGGSSSGINPIILRQNIGLATAKSPAGPWTRQAAPILEPTGVNGTWDQLFVTNPAGCAHSTTTHTLCAVAHRCSASQLPRVNVRP
jgi:hypothetical protein